MSTYFDFNKVETQTTLVPEKSLYRSVERNRNDLKTSIVYKPSPEPFYIINNKFKAPSRKNRKFDHHINPFENIRRSNPLGEY